MTTRTALLASLGLAALVAGCGADTTTANPTGTPAMQQQPRYGISQEDRFVTARGGSSPGTISGVTGGVGEQNPAGPRVTGVGSGSAGQQGMIALATGDNQFVYVPASEYAQYQRRPRTSSGGPSRQQVVEFSRLLDRAEQAIGSGRLSAAAQDIARAETMVWRARTPEQSYEPALRDLATARTAANRGDAAAAREAISALKSRMRAAT